MRIWSKNRGFLVMVKFVSACVERDKKNLKNFDFCAQLPAHFTPLKRRGGSITATELHGVGKKSKIVRTLRHAQD